MIDTAAPFTPTPVMATLDTTDAPYEAPFPFSASSRIEQLAVALAAAHAEMPSIAKDKTADTGKFSYSYADLSTILSITRPVLAKAGIVVLQPATVEAKGSVKIRTVVLHVSGQWISECLTVPVTDSGDPQKLGSAMSYGRRYSYCSLLGIQPEDEDDDGHAGTAPEKGRRRPAPVQTASAEDYITDAQKARLLGIVKEHRIDPKTFGSSIQATYKVDGWNAIRRKDYDAIVALAQNWSSTGDDRRQREPGDDDN